MGGPEAGRLQAGLPRPQQALGLLFSSAGSRGAAGRVLSSPQLPHEAVPSLAPWSPGLGSAPIQRLARHLPAACTAAPGLPRRRAGRPSPATSRPAPRAPGRSQPAPRPGPDPGGWRGGGRAQTDGPAGVAAGRERRAGARPERRCENVPGTVPAGGRGGPWTGSGLASSRRARRGAGPDGVCAGAEPAAAWKRPQPAAPAAERPVRASRARRRAVLDVRPRCQPRGAAGPLARSPAANLNHAGSQPGRPAGPRAAGRAGPQAGERAARSGPGSRGRGDGGTPEALATGGGGRRLIDSGDVRGGGVPAGREGGGGS